MTSSIMDYNTYLSYRQMNGGRGKDMNVTAAWKQGYSGKGVVVTILDDGIEKDHPDLKQNYDAQASYDVNSHDADPQPRYDYSNENSASWGPDDDGRTVDGPATLARRAFYDGITKGRGGLGSIFVWASGNGGRDGDSCNCDGYTNSIYTLSISSATEYGNIPWYSEPCSSTLATTYSSGSGGEKQIITTDLRKTCTETHTGTSASAPLAAGICALALGANPLLNWRDLQHIVVLTANKRNLQASDWTLNGVGRPVSHSFGFGLMDAGRMVELAKNWTSVPEQHICEIRSKDNNKVVPMNGKITVFLPTNGCEGAINHVKYLEHVQARITLTASRRGEISIYLTSPAGTRSTLLARRVRDMSREGFNNWAFMTTHSWGEMASGKWILEIENGASSFRGAKLKDWVLVLYGTDRHPQERSTTTTTTTTTTPKHKKRKPELKAWTLVVMGTQSHPQSQNVTQPTSREHPFKCAGVTTNGVCTECRPGFYTHNQGCVKTCPDYFYGTMETTHTGRHIRNQSISKAQQFHRHGVCLPCNVACKTCKGQYVEDCFQCNRGYEVRDGYCRKKLIMNFLDPDMLSFFVWVIILCTCAILLFGVVFIVLQARDHKILCWKEKRHYDEGKGNYKDVSTEDHNSDSDHQYVEVLQNRHFDMRYSTNHSHHHHHLPHLPHLPRLPHPHILSHHSSTH
ncbi:hypothetical protein KUTeg_018172 [Tegillarca granosa]|uniref:P/Homo B domain-containing protein n=1 Tax=Tegillarca granosa TaxID=220873 RepID=A0ABQ9EII9_TEGGR|nr:hypothetical protein KUTeg_018172 [Tegillarca granosa]